MKPKNYFLLLGLLAFVGLSSCNSERSKNEVWEIASEKLPVVHVRGAEVESNPDWWAYIVKYKPKGEWQGVNVSFPNFDYQEGYEYSIRVKTTYHKDVNMQDAQKWETHEFLEVLSKTKKESQNLPTEPLRIYFYF